MMGKPCRVSDYGTLAKHSRVWIERPPVWQPRSIRVHVESAEELLSDALPKRLQSL